MDSMPGLSIVSTSHAHAHPHMTTHIRIRIDIGSSSERTEHCRGGHPCSLRPRRRETSADAPPFLKASVSVLLSDAPLRRRRAPVDTALRAARRSSPPRMLYAIKRAFKL